ncbi:hypothetical protein ABT026_09905 [Streptomyces sp. NPDC002734]|uniref:hypothetical protein n=1 Tax=Streptomyces sp. NPDC002734 TaxID=3154426 RepID=UPI00331E05D4
MRIRIATAAVAAVLAVTAVGCDSGGDGKDDIGAPAPAASSAAGSSAPAEDGAGDEAEDGAGGDTAGGASDSPAPEASDAALPPEPQGTARADVMRVVFDVDVSLFKDEEKAIYAARKQCAALDSGVADPDHSAAELFSYNGITPTDEDGSHLNYGLRRTLCPAS